MLTPLPGWITATPPETLADWREEPSEPGLYWDGLFSENPPITPFLRYRNGLKPNEILILRINPRATPERPDTGVAREDRHNELLCNLSLEQEIRQVRQVNIILNRLERAGAGGVLKDYHPVAVREIDLPWEEHRHLRLMDKYTRLPGTVEARIDKGARWVELFFQGRIGHLHNWAEP